MKKLKGILFDFNGTLLFDSRMHIGAMTKAFLAFGAPAPDADYLISSVFGKTNEQIYRENVNQSGPYEECDAFRAYKEQAYYDLCLALGEDFKLGEGVCEMLDYLKENKIPYCLATGSGIDEVNFFMEHLGLDRWFSFDNIVYTDFTFRGKPAPDCYILAAERLGLTPSDCLVFEDGSAGIRAANAAGAGAVVAVFEEGIPSPLNDGITVSATYHSFGGWRDILSGFGL